MTTPDTTTTPERRTKRRFAHELYPHAGEWETRPLEVEVPYLYARAIGMDVWGTSWFDMTGEAAGTSGDRTLAMINANRIALLADALHQGMTGDEAWAWADQRNHAEVAGEFIYERGRHYGVPVDQIKPYLCGPEPDNHAHYGEPDANGWREVFTIDCPESKCEECTEPVDAEGAEASTAR